MQLPTDNCLLTKHDHSAVVSIKLDAQVNISNTRCVLSDIQTLRSRLGTSIATRGEMYRVVEEATTRAFACSQFSFDSP